MQYTLERASQDLSKPIDQVIFEYNRLPEEIDAISRIINALIAEGYPLETQVHFQNGKIGPRGQELCGECGVEVGVKVFINKPGTKKDDEYYDGLDKFEEVRYTACGHSLTRQKQLEKSQRLEKQLRVLDPEHDVDPEDEIDLD